MNVPEVLNSFQFHRGRRLLLDGNCNGRSFLVFGSVYGLYQRFFDRYPVILALFAAFHSLRLQNI